MSVYLIGYDLNREGSNYSKKNAKMISRILQKFPTRWHELDSTWLVESDESASEIRNDLLDCIDSNDELLVVRLSGAAAWTRGFNENAQDWLRSVLRAFSI